MSSCRNISPFAHTDRVLSARLFLWHIVCSGLLEYCTFCSSSFSSGNLCIFADLGFLHKPVADHVSSNAAERPPAPRTALPARRGCRGPLCKRWRVQLRSNKERGAQVCRPCRLRAPAGRRVLRAPVPLSAAGPGAAVVPVERPAWRALCPLGGWGLRVGGRVYARVPPRDVYLGGLLLRHEEGSSGLCQWVLIGQLNELNEKTPCYTAPQGAHSMLSAQAKRASLDACVERLCMLRLRMQPRVGGAPSNTSCGP